MLSPGTRCLYTDALMPPAGMELDCGVATTYSLDMDTLLTIPLQLVFATAGNQRELIRDGVALLSALREATDKISIFCQRGGIHVPSRDHVLYPLLERMIYQAEAPKGGAFHPKVWLLRFTDPKKQHIRHRLMILSRNITDSSSWDVSLTLDGTPTDSARSQNEQLAELVEALPKLADASIDKTRARSMEKLADEVRTTRWELPDGYKSLEFHLTGLNGRKWQPPGCAAIIVISPFLTEAALRELYRKAPAGKRALLSTQDSLDGIDPSALEYYSRIVTLHDDASVDNEEETTPTSLHAKLYVYSRYYSTHIVLGSANATSPAIKSGVNVELMAELKGRPHNIGEPMDILAPEKGLGDLLVDYTPGEKREEDEETRRVEDSLDAAQKALASSQLSLRCSREDDAYALELCSSEAIAFPDLDAAIAWPITLREHTAVDASGLGPGSPLRFPDMSATSVTGLIAFDLNLQDCSRRFVLNLPLTNPPADREGAIIRTVVNNREGFIRYLMLMLNLESAQMSAGSSGGLFSWSSLGLHCGEDGSGLLEQLLTALANSPETLLSIDRLVRSIQKDSEAQDILPAGFMDMWETFREVISTDA